MTDQARATTLKTFVAWTAAHISGDEKGEAQIFLDRLFQAFGWPGLLDAGAHCELRVKNDSGGTAFADLVWKPIVLIEMKRRGVDLAHHYRQAFDYWTHLVPGRPRYVVLCNFDEFWVYDFETQMDVPVDKLSLNDLPIRFGPLAFLSKEEALPVFGNHQETVTRQAADKLAECFNSLLVRNVDRTLAQRFILQFLMALFAEDIGLLERYMVVRLLKDCAKPRDAYDLLGGLFEAMNTKKSATGGRYKDVAYFNGGLFRVPARVELEMAELAKLQEAAQFDWSKVRPEIFGALFEHSLGKEERHAFGAHFTSPVDIMKIVGPTIVEPWREAIEEANSLRELGVLLERVERFTVLDPACGSGNFLYIAYRELKRLETRIYERMVQDYKSVNPTGRPFGFVNTRNFYGMDINPFAVEIAKVTMMLAHKLAIDELRSNEEALPLDNLDANFTAGDALIQQNGLPVDWPQTDVIIGNPPFLGAKRLKPERGTEYVNAVRRAYSDVPGMADYCVFWFRRAHDELRMCTTDDPFAGRAGLVGTQNIRNTASREGSLDYIVRDGTIVEAVNNQPWSGEANVHVSIVNWVKSQDSKLVPRKKRLWFETSMDLPAGGIPAKRKKGFRADKKYDLDCTLISRINSSLSDQIDVSTSRELLCNRTPQRVFQGVTPGYDGFVLEPDAAAALLNAEPAAEEIVRPYLIGRELNSADSRPKRYLIDAYGLNVNDLPRYPKTFEHLKTQVLPKVQSKLEEEKAKESDMVKARAEHLERWWTFWAQRIDLRRWLANHKRVVAASRTQRTPFIFSFVAADIAHGDKLQLFAFDDDYSFGVLQSSPHCSWYAAKGARLKNEIDYNYSSDAVFCTFPWPQAPSNAVVDAVARAGKAIREKRREALTNGVAVRDLYATLQLPGKNDLKDLHAELDAAVLRAYGFSPKDDLLTQLLDLNLTVAAAIEHLQHVTMPGIPAIYPNPDSLITADALGR